MKSSRRLSVLFLALILLITLASFLPSLRNDFTNWDDPFHVTENRTVQHLSFSNLKRMFSSFYVGNYLPLTMLSYALEYHFFGANPFVYHLASLVIHLLNCVLVFVLILLLSRNLLVAFCTALLFGIHPLHVESVAWISERKDVLYAFFFLGSLIFYLLYSRKGRTKGYYVLVVFLFLLSLLAKPMALTLPLILFLIDYLEKRQWQKAVFLEKIPFLILSLGFGILTFLAQRSHGAIKESQALWSGVQAGAYGLLFYLGNGPNQTFGFLSLSRTALRNPSTDSSVCAGSGFSSDSPGGFFRPVRPSYCLRQSVFRLHPCAGAPACADRRDDSG